MANWDVGCYPIDDPVEIPRIMCALDPDVLNAVVSVRAAAPHQDLLVKKAGHHIDYKGNDDRTKQVRERGVR